MDEKKTLLSKFNIKDYKNELEVILEVKRFEDEAKNLILSIFYKLDNFYKDYSTVKKDAEIKNKVLEEYIKIIKTKCKTIQLIKPQELIEGKKYYVDKKNGEIKCIPNELILAYAIYELTEKNIPEERYLLDDFTKVCFTNILNKGETINAIEPIRDFNGWSWNIQIENNENIVNNLIYQNMLILFGYQFMHENLYKSNILNLFELKAKDEYGEKGVNFLNILLKTCIILYNNQSEEKHEKCLKYKKSLISKKNMLSNRKEYVQGTNQKSSGISKEIREIDELLVDINLIRKEYAKMIQEDRRKYFCISDFVEDKEEERKRLLEKIKSNNKILNEGNYLSNHDDYEETLNLYKSINDNKIKVNYISELEILQKSFLNCIKEKIGKIDNKKDLYDICVQIRYYCNLLINKKDDIISYEKLSENVKEILSELVQKMIDLKLVETGFSSFKLNYDIIEYIFKTKIITLETINLRVSFKQEEKIEVEYYDSKILEHKEIFDIPSDDEITNKKDRKFKLFKIGG